MLLKPALPALRGLLLILALLIHATAGAECVGLVLGGGGARGAAHIGVLQVLERERIPICALAGTSMGAIVGSLYAVGYTPDEIEAILAAVDWKDMLNDDPPREQQPMRRKQDDLAGLLDLQLGFRDGRVIVPRGVVQGQKLELLLRRLLLPAWQIEHFDQLPIPFRCVATDIGRGEGVVFERGDLARSVRASMSVPGAFAPIRLGGRLLVDGGIHNNVPVDVVRAMGADRLIVVDVSAPLAAESALTSPLAISMQMIDMLMRERTRQMLASLAATDVLLRPDLGDLGSADFGRTAEAVAIGRAAAETQLQRLRALRPGPAAQARFAARHRKGQFDPGLVSFIEVAKGRSLTAERVGNRLADLALPPLDLDALESDIGRAFGEGRYERILWAPVERDGRVGIEVLPVDKGWGPTFLRFGLSFNDNFAGDSDYAMNVESTTTGFNAAGGEWRNRIDIGRIGGLYSEFHQPWGALGQYFAEAGLRYRVFDQPLRLGERELTELRLSEWLGSLRVGHDIGQSARLFAGLSRGYSQASSRRAGLSFDEEVEGSFTAWTVGAVYDRLDAVSFPTAGSRASIEAELYREGLGSGRFHGEVLRLGWDRASSWDRHRWVIGARFGASWDAAPPLRALNVLGGFTELSGIAERALVGNQSALFRALYYRRFGDMEALFSIPAYIGASLEAGNVWSRRQDASFDDLILAASLFVAADSPLGPVFFGYGRAENGEQSLYLRFGPLIRP